MLTIMGHNNDFFKQTGLRIMNGRVGNDGGVGRFTFVGSRGRSLVDNVLPSQNMLQLVKLLEYRNQILYQTIVSLNLALNVRVK